MLDYLVWKIIRYNTDICWNEQYPHEENTKPAAGSNQKKEVFSQQSKDNVAWNVGTNDRNDMNKLIHIMNKLKKIKWIN